MTAIAVEITRRPVAGLPKSAVRSAAPEPVGLVIVEDVEALADGAGCSDDNPYQGS
ncbi:hypothetical protein [Streptomyces acidiscabies]|uniref:hypothetical protein n=1 Tax=Streptomyces acidiscabies TaxID=42234 RepID=UPI0038F7EF54